MKLLLYAGFLYLIGIAIILLVQPGIMFRTDGVWKEFGIGRNPERYTWMPFWLFSILWAVLSYMILLLMASANILPGIRALTDITVNETEYELNDMTSSVSVGKAKAKAKAGGGAKPGYYILNSQASRNGAPKYIYLGPEAPNLVYSENLT